MSLVIILAIIISFIVIELLRYKAEKKEEPKRTWKTVFADGAEQLLIIFSSALVAMSLASTMENNTRKDQIINILDVAEEQLQNKLSLFRSASESGVTYFSVEEDPEIREQNEKSNVVDMFYNGCIKETYINLQEYLFSESVIDRVDPKLAVMIAMFEKDMNQWQDTFIKHYQDVENPDYSLNLYNTMRDIALYDARLIEFIECEKSHLRGRPQNDWSDTFFKYLPEKSLEDYQAFETNMARFTSDSFRNFE